MDNMRIYNAVSSVPEEAKKKITGGNLNGMTDINPMWRIRTLTELFGPCGIGWKPVNPRYWTEPGANEEVLAFCEVGLVYKENGEWSDPIMGIGGSKTITKNKNGLQSSDEAYKMAYTDAISVCCKLLGVGSSVYWERGETKYMSQNNAAQKEVPAQKEVQKEIICHVCGEVIGPQKNGDQIFSAQSIISKSMKSFGKPACFSCAVKLNGSKDG